MISRSFSEPWAPVAVPYANVAESRHVEQNARVFLVTPIGAKEVTFLQLRIDDTANQLGLKSFKEINVPHAIIADTVCQHRALIDFETIVHEFL